MDNTSVEIISTSTIIETTNNSNAIQPDKARTILEDFKNTLDNSPEVEICDNTFANRGNNTMEATMETTELVNELTNYVKTITEILALQKQIFVTLAKDHKLIKIFINIANDLTLIQQEYIEILRILDPSNISSQTTSPAKLIEVQSPQDLCLPIINLFTDFINKRIFDAILQVIKAMAKSGMPTQKQENDLIILQAKLNAIKDYIYVIVTFNRNDLFALRKDQEEWKRLNDFVEIKSLGDHLKIQKSLQEMVTKIQISNAMIDVASRETNNKFIKNVYATFGAMYFFFFTEEARRRTELAFAQPKNENVVEVWNLMDSNVIKNMVRIVLPSITECKKIYIPRIYPEITHDVIMQEANNQTINNITLAPRMSYKRNNAGIWKKDHSKVKIRILSDKKLPNIHEGNSSQETSGLRSFFNVFSCTGSREYDISSKTDPYFDGIVIHIHGGGFIAMSSGSHQNYTRQWAKILKKPIFSIDYRLAPDYPFPAALDDCWQAYNWIIDNVESALGIIPSKVILAGDSAGGNLALSVTLRAIKLGYRIPDGLLLAYPALNVSIKHFSPSLLYAMDDQIVPYSLLKVCVDVYVPKDLSPETNPFISPIAASDELLMQLPPIRIVVGSKDPLHDECWRLLNRLKNLNKTAYMTVYENLPHGFLSYDMPTGMPESKICIEDAAKYMKDLMDGKQNMKYYEQLAKGEREEQKGEDQKDEIKSINHGTKIKWRVCFG